MFNDNFLLTQAVLEGRKTQTRRIITHPKTFKGKDICGFYVCRRATDGVITEICMYDEDEIPIDEGQILPKYKVGEVIAVAQSYRDCGGLNEDGIPMWEIISQKAGSSNAGWDNKMFVRADIMPHQIRITNVRVERLQDISDEDCLKEGVVVNEPKIKGGINMYYPCEYLRSCAKEVGWGRVFHTPREAFAHLINKVSRKDVWSENPYVFVYDFELVK